MTDKTHLTGLTKAELERFVGDLGEPAYRGRQIFGALQRRRLRAFGEMTDLPKSFRERLSEVATASTLTVESRYVAEDGTRRYLMKTHDGLPVETVFIPEERRDTICFSSQSGCPLQCDFCLTAKLGAMGAGEPFLAFDPLMKALRVMSDEDGLHIVPNRVTVSTAGVVPKIKELARVPERPHLAISLAAPNDELRDQLMPINRKWPIRELLAACKEFEKSLKANER